VPFPSRDKVPESRPARHAHGGWVWQGPGRQ